MNDKSVNLCVKIYIGIYVLCKYSTNWSIEKVLAKPKFIGWFLKMLYILEFESFKA